MSNMNLQTQEKSIEITIEPLGGLVTVGKNSQVSIEWPSNHKLDIPTIYLLDASSLMFWAERGFIRVKVNNITEYEYWPE